MRDYRQIPLYTEDIYTHLLFTVIPLYAWICSTCSSIFSATTELKNSVRVCLRLGAYTMSGCLCSSDILPQEAQGNGSLLMPYIETLYHANQEKFINYRENKNTNKP